MRDDPQTLMHPFGAIDRMLHVDAAPFVRRVIGST
jgi:hypothetical protein